MGEEERGDRQSATWQRSFNFADDIHAINGLVEKIVKLFPCGERCLQLGSREILFRQGSNVGSKVIDMMTESG